MTLNSPSFAFTSQMLALQARASMLSLGIKHLTTGSFKISRSPNDWDSQDMTFHCQCPSEVRVDENVSVLVWNLLFFSP